MHTHFTARFNGVGTPDETTTNAITSALLVVGCPFEDAMTVRLKLREQVANTPWVISYTSLHSYTMKIGYED